MRFLLTWITILFSVFANAQNNFGFADGTIIFKKGDSVVCLIQREVNYGDVITYKYYHEGKEIKVKSGLVKSIRIGTAFIENIPLGNTEKLATLIRRGKLNLYSYVDLKAGEPVPVPGTNGGMVSPYKSTLYYVAGKSEKYTEIREKFFKSDLKSLVADCQEIMDNLEGDIYVFKDVPAIIELYNACDNQALRIISLREYMQGLERWLQDSLYFKNCFISSFKITPIHLPYHPFEKCLPIA